MNRSSLGNSDNVKDLSIYFPCEKIAGNCLVRDLGNNLYRLVEHPTLIESAAFGDTILVEVGASGQINFIKVVQKSEYHEIGRLFEESFIESQEFNQYLKTLEEKGIYWQIDFGGMFFCFPRGEDVDGIKSSLESLLIR